MLSNTIIAAFVVSATVLSGIASAQPYPNKPIRLVVPFTAGGGTDITARILGQKLAQRLQTRVVIDNVPAPAGS